MCPYLSKNKYVEHQCPYLVGWLTGCLRKLLGMTRVFQHLQHQEEDYQSSYWFSVSLFITVRKRSCGKVMFSQACVKNSVHKEECPGPGPLGTVSRPRPRGSAQGGGVQALGVLPWGCPGQGECPGPGGVQAQAQGVSSSRPRGVCIPACTEADTPPPRRWVLVRTVRILPECILVTRNYRKTGVNGV